MRDLNLLVLRCRDVDASRRFYELLGMVFVRHRHGAGPEHYASEDERGAFEIYPASGDGPADNTGLGFRVADLAAALERFIAAGHAPSSPRDHEWGRTFVVRDPDGRRVEIAGPKGTE